MEALAIVHCDTVDEMLPHYDLITQLTPELSAGEYARIFREMVPHRYHQAAILQGGHAVAVSGYWIGHKLYSGRYLEVDNFVVDRDHRARGIGQLLLDHVLEVAREEQCRHVMLDAYLENEAAHRFYARNGFIKRGFHFMKHL